ncbi:MAG: family 20 glycosylhydrolase [Opitutales bacterium]
MIRAFQWDLARQVERREVLSRLLPRYAGWGYQELYLHLEDAVHYPSLPGIGRDDAYCYEDLGELVLGAAQAGLRTVPIVNLLGHTQYLIKHPGLRDLNELRDARGRPLPRGQICPLHPRTLEVADQLLHDLAPYCTAGKVHVGLDESFHLGQCPRCREEVARIGLAAHFAGHVRRLHALCAALGLEMGLWADMLYFLPGAIPLLPQGLIAYDWYYYPFPRAPRVEFFNYAEHDLAAPLRAQGIRYYGCPMSGAFRAEPLPVFGDRLGNVRSWWRRCHEVKADGFLVTSWEAGRLALETGTTVDAAAAGLWLEPGADDATTLLARGLERALAMKSGRAAARQLLAADEYAFAGYARWQINDRWDLSAGTGGVKPGEKERRFFHRLAERARREQWPDALAASLAFRLYLAERDVFVRQAARDVFHWRRLLRKGDGALVTYYITKARKAAADFGRRLTAGLKAARVMWRCTRDPRLGGANETMLEHDAQRLAAWVDWLRQVRRDPALVHGPSPVCGTWQLQCWVHNLEPGGQRVGAEQRQPDGTWRELAGRPTLEFRAHAARPRTKLKREFNVPVEPAADGAEPILRLVAKGVGRVALSHVQLTDGVVIRRTTAPRELVWLGHRAPTEGFPRPDPAGDAWQLEFTGPTSAP